MPKAKLPTTRKQALKLIDNFIEDPTFESFYRIRSFVTDAGPVLCSVIGSKNLNVRVCEKCPLYQEEEVYDDYVENDLCGVIYDDGVMANQVLAMWDKYKGEVLLNLVRFRAMV